MAYPSVISTLATPLSSDRLNSPSHSALHQNENSGITEIQNFVGTLASTAGTLIYDIRAAASNGGGHIQTANKGGTGQTSYNKGDVLVGQSTSVLTKLAIGADTFVLTADSAQSAGVKWAVPGGTKMAINSSVFTTGSTTTETSVMAASVLASVIGTNNAVRSELFINQMATVNQSLTIRVNFGTSSIATIAVGESANVTSIQGVLQTYIIGNGASSQLGIVKLTTGRQQLTTTGNSVLSNLFYQTQTPLSVDVGANQVLGTTFTWAGTNGGTFITTGGYIVEKIV